MLTTEQKTAAERVNRSFSIVDHVPHELHTSGRYFIGACPFCGGRDRFQVKQSDAGQLWVCRHCQPTYGDAVSFLMRGGATFGDVITHFGGYAHATVSSHAGWAETRTPLRPNPATQTKEVATAVPCEPPCDNWQAVAWQAVGHAAERLQSEYEQGTAVAKWLQGRGIDRHAAERFGLGYNPTWMGTAVGQLAPGIIIPCWDDSGLWYVKVRLTKQAAEQVGAKYLLLKGSNAHALYNATAVAMASDVLIVEGEFDTILGTLYAPKGTAVATLGAATMTLENAPAWGNLLANKRVLVAMDNDGAGQLAAEKWKVWPFVTAANPLPSDAKDITELWQKHGLGGLTNYLWKVENATK